MKKESNIINWEKFNQEIEEERQIIKRLEQRRNEIIPSIKIDLNNLQAKDLENILNYLEENHIKFEETFPRDTNNKEDIIKLFSISINKATAEEIIEFINNLKEKKMGFKCSLNNF